MLANGETVRFAIASDADALLKHVDVSDVVLRRKIEAGDFVIAVSESELLGFLQLEYLWSKVPYLALIRVLNGHRRRGVGKALLGFLEDHLRENGHAVLYSSSQADEPEPQEWHRHVGFTECGLLKEINDGIDEIFFRKTISGK